MPHLDNLPTLWDRWYSSSQSVETTWKYYPGTGFRWSHHGNVHWRRMWILICWIQMFESWQLKANLVGALCEFETMFIFIHKWHVHIYIYTHTHIHIYNIRTCKPFIYIYISICKWAVLHTRGVLLRSNKSRQVPDGFIRLQVSKWGSPSPRVDHALIWSISHLSWFTTHFPGWKSRIFPILRRLQRLLLQGPQTFIPQNCPIFEPHFRWGKLGDHFNIEDRWLVRLDELMRHLDCLGGSLKWQVAIGVVTSVPSQLINHCNNATKTLFCQA